MRWERKAIAVTALVLVLFGLVMVMSATVGVGGARVDNGYFVKQLMWAGLALVVFAVSSQIPYEALLKMRWPLLALATGLLVAVLVPGVGVLRNGARRWLAIGPFTFQPSEFAKLALVVFFAGLCGQVPKTTSDHRRLVFIAVAATLAIAALVVIEPDFGTAAIIAALGGFMLFMNGVRLRYLLGLGLVATGAATALVVTAPYRLLRVTSFLNWEADPLGSGYHIRQSLIALGSGGLGGVGVGAGMQKYSFVPAAQTDFIFAIIGEETGLAGTLMVLALFATFFLCAVRVAQASKERASAMLAIGIGTLITLQAMVNMAVVTALLPTKGLALPMMSRGGSSLVLTMAMVGVLYNVAARSLPAPARELAR